jgi:hypothetical protein
VDDASWTATFKFMADMNKKRGDFLDKVKWMNWVIRLANIVPAEEVDVEEEQEGYEEQDFETHKLNYIWYTLLEKPGFIILFQTSLSMKTKMKTNFSNPNWSAGPSSIVGGHIRHQPIPPLS